MRPLDCPAGYRDAKPRTSDDDYQLLSTALAAQARLSASKLCGTGGKVDTASLGLSKLNGCISKPPAAAWVSWLGERALADKGPCPTSSTDSVTIHPSPLPQVMAEATVEYECKDGKHGTVGEGGRSDAWARQARRRLLSCQLLGMRRLVHRARPRRTLPPCRPHHGWPVQVVVSGCSSSCSTALQGCGGPGCDLQLDLITLQCPIHPSSSPPSPIISHHRSLHLMHAPPPSPPHTPFCLSSDAPDPSSSSSV